MSAAELKQHGADPEGVIVAACSHREVSPYPGPCVASLRRADRDSVSYKA